MWRRPTKPKALWLSAYPERIKKVAANPWSRFSHKWRQQPENKKCLMCGKGPTDPHHVIPRSLRKDLVCHPDNVIPICFKHHVWIHGHFDDARTRGLIGNSWDDLAALKALRDAKL